MKLHIEPIVILVPTRITDEALSYLQPEQSSSESVNNDECKLCHLQSVLTNIQTACIYSPSYSLQIRPSKEFKFETGKSKLQGLNLSALVGQLDRIILPGDNSRHVGTGEERRGPESILQLSGFLDLSCEIAVRVSSGTLPSLTALGRLCGSCYWISNETSF